LKQRCCRAHWEVRLEEKQRGARDNTAERQEDSQDLAGGHQRSWSRSEHRPAMSSPGQGSKEEFGQKSKEENLFRSFYEIIMTLITKPAGNRTYTRRNNRLVSLLNVDRRKLKG
jgi:hypothetical protein